MRERGFLFLGEMFMKSSDSTTDAAKRRQKAEELHKKRMADSGSTPTETDALNLVHSLEVPQIELEMQNEELTLAKEQAKSAESKYSELYDFAPCGYFTFSAAGEIIDANLTGAQMLGMERSRVLHQPFRSFVTDDAKPVFDGFFKKVCSERSKEFCDLSLITEGGAPMVVHIIGIVSDSTGLCLVTVVDITERQQAEIVLRKSEEKYRGLVLYSNDPIFNFNPDETYRFVNEAFAKPFGKRPDEIIGKKPHSIFSYEEAEKRLTLVRQVFLTGEKREIEVKVVAQTGEVRYYLTMADPIKNEQGEVMYVSCISKNITERKNIEIERERLIVELQNALEQIKTLKGIVPICAHCKKIRDDKGFWEQVEMYVEKHTDAQFSHSLCPDCIGTYFPNISQKK
jgi:PAS domain S-box-containing protein